MDYPIVNIYGKRRIQDAGVTLADFKASYGRHCFLRCGDRDHRIDSFVLKNGETYDLFIPDHGSAPEYEPQSGEFLSPSLPLPTVNLSIPLSEVPSVPLSPNACPHPIGVTETVCTILDHVKRTIDFKTDAQRRKTLIMISRCPRGGKTTILEAIHKSLKSEGVNVLSVSFNGVSGFKRMKNETPCESLYRLVTNQLDPSLDRQAPRIMDWITLDAYISSERFVLLIDELNVLCSSVGSELAGVLKSYFLDKAGRHLIVTSHQPYLENSVAVGGGGGSEYDVNDVAAGVGKMWSDSVEALSERSLTLVSMPHCTDVTLLRNMDILYCSAITPSVAAYYGNIPSLMYAVSIQPEESPAVKFGRVVPGLSHNKVQWLQFVQALLTGIPSPSLQRFFCFSSAVEFDPSLGILMKWPLCYISCIMRYFVGPTIHESMAEWIEELRSDCSKTSDGMVWEQSVRIAILLRFQVAAAFEAWEPPFGLCSASEATGADVHVLYLGESVTSISDVQQVVESRKMRFSSNTLVLFVPTDARLQQFDGFCVRFESNEVRDVCGYQCKANRKGADGVVPEWMNKGGHLLRSKAPTECRVGGQNEKGWTYYNEKKTDQFLGWSLRVMR